jgi:hypothetical protein
MLDVDRPLTADEYENDDQPRHSPIPADALTSALGAAGYVTDYAVEECRQELLDGTGRKLFPERFDRFYFEPTRLLVDVVRDDDPQVSGEQRKAKRVAFKMAWCAANGWHYLAIPESESFDADQVRALVARLDRGPQHETEEHERVEMSKAASLEQPVKRGPGRPRGAVSRPKATV